MLSELFEWWQSPFAVLTDVIDCDVDRLKWNDLGPDGAAHLAQALSVMTGMTSLEYVVC